jgi:transcriptional regulator with XRE-family HTH domain
MKVGDDVAMLLGMELRRARQALHLGQRAVADRIGCSQPTVSRLELGRGAGYSLALWSAAAIAIDRRLHVEILARELEDSTPVSLGLRCHRTVVAAARRGGWGATTEIVRSGASERIETVLDRGPERVLVHVWDVVANVDERLAEFDGRLNRLDRPSPGPAPLGLVIVPSTYGNRRRMTESRMALQRLLPALGAKWFAALHSPARPLPAEPGVIWVDRSGLRLLPAPSVPGWAWTSVDRASLALSRRAT